MADEQVMTKEAWLEERLAQFEKALGCTRKDDPNTVVWEFGTKKMLEFETAMDERISRLLNNNSEEVERRRKSQATVQLIVDTVTALAKANSA